jgi:hypothetical protein
MKKKFYIIFLILFYNLSFSQIYTEKQINQLAREMSDNLSGMKIQDSDIVINRIYSIDRDIVVVYIVPEDMILDEKNIKSEKLEQMKAFGGDIFNKNQINFQLWFIKDKKMYKNLRINYYEFK